MKPKIWFVNKDMLAKPLCQMKHLGKALCARAHEIPKDTFWSGEVPGDEKGDFVIDLRAARRAFIKALTRWQNTLEGMRALRPAPAMREYLKKIHDEHLGNKPVFTFTWKPGPQD